MTLVVEFQSVTDRDFFARAGMTEGIGQGLDRFARVLAARLADQPDRDGDHHG